MKASCIIPVKRLNGIKSRLTSLLGVMERRKMNLNMLEDVVISAKAAHSIDEIVVVSPDKEILEFAERLGAKALPERSEDGVNLAVKRATKFCLEAEAVASVVFPSDIPLITPQDIDEIVGMAEKQESVVLTPSVRLDGTNALLRSPPTAMRTYYDQDSFESHYREALDLELRFKLYLSRRVMLDLDSPRDVQEFVTLKSKTLTQEFLEEVL